jgi:beta-N-acetylglucosaminidase
VDDLEKEIAELKARGEQWIAATDKRGVPALFLLSKAVIRLDKSSTFLARVNIGLGAVVILIGVLQIIIMLRGH